MPSFRDYSGIKNVKGFGAVGNGSTDDTTAIQNAINYSTSPFSSTDRGIIWFPPGTYLISSPLSVSTSIRRIIFDGAGARITGNIAGALISRVVDSPFAGVYEVKNLQLYNTNASAGIGVLWHSTIGGGLYNCEINAWRGVETYNSQATSIMGCNIIAPGASASSIGIVAGNATSVINTDVTGYAEGLRHQNAGLYVSGGRFEVNTIGIRLGVDEDGDTFQTSGFHVAPGSCEQNMTGLQSVAAAGGFIGGTSFGSGVQVTCGIDIQGIQDALIAGVVISSAGGFTDVGFRVDGATRLTVLSTSAPSSSIDGGVSQTSWAANSLS